MKICDCGGLLRRHSVDYIPSTDEMKVRLRCNECKKFESVYYDGTELPAMKLRRHPNGRPSYVELK